jgi:hypothetical protein
MVKGGRQSLKAEVVIGASANIERLDFDALVEPNSLPAGSKLDLGKTDAH